MKGSEETGASTTGRRHASAPQQQSPARAPAAATHHQTATARLQAQLQQRLSLAQLQQLNHSPLENSDGLYLQHLLEIAQETGQDTTGYLPWQAPPSWSRSIQPFYRVLSAERQRDSAAPNTAPAPRSEGDLLEVARAWGLLELSLPDATAQMVLQALARDLPDPSIAPPVEIVYQAMEHFLSRQDPAAQTRTPGSLHEGLREHGSPEADDLLALQTDFAPYPMLPDALTAQSDALFALDASALEASAVPMDAAVMREAAGSPRWDAATVLNQVRESRGAPLSDEVASRMGAAMGWDFRSVRVHTGAEADRACRAIAARAFTTGADIYFAAGTFAPGTQDGDRLLAHELTHVMQAASGELAVDSGVSDPGDQHEVEARTRAEHTLDQLRAQDSSAQATGAQATGPHADAIPSGAEAPRQGADGAIISRKEESTESTESTEAAESEEDDSYLAQLIAELFERIAGGGEGAEPADDDAPDLETCEEEEEETEPAGEQSSGTEVEPESGAPLAIPGECEAVEIAEPSAAPAVEESTAPTSSPGRKPDGMTDYYMEVHWDPEAFHTLGKNVGYPDGPSAVSEIDKLLPADTSPEVRAAINVAVAIGSGMLDDWVISEAAEYIGLPAGLVEGLIGLAKDISSRAELEDPVSMGLYFGLGTLDAVGSALELVVDKALEDCANLQLALDGLTLLTTTLGQVIALGASILGPPGVATVEAAILTIDGWCQGIHLALETVRTPVQSIKAVIDIVQAATTTIDYVYHDYQANEAEAAGEFEKAAGYRDLARGMVIDHLLEWLSALKNVAFAIPMIGARGKEFERTAALVANAGRRVATAVIGGGDGEGGGGMGAVDLAKLIVDELAKGTDWWHEVGLPGMQADTMRSGDMEGVPLSSGGSTGALDTARGQSITWLETAGTNLAADGPEWYQKLVNEIAVPPDASLSDELSPTYWLMEFLGQIPYVWELVKDGSLTGLAAGCDAVAEVLPLAQPFADEFTAMFNGIKPQLDEAIVELDAFVQEQTLSMDTMELMLSQLEEGLTTVDEMSSAGGDVDELLQQVIDTLDGLRLDPSALNLPSVVPASAVDEAVSPINTLLDEAIERLQGGKDTLVVSLSETISSITDALQAKLGMVQTSIAEGGSFRVELETQVQIFKATVHATTEAFLQMDATIDIDCGAAAAWLSSVAAACRAAAAEEDQSTQNKWAEILLKTAQPAVDSWRAQHSDEVETQYYPEVPAWELAAVDAVWGGISGRTDVDSIRLYHLEKTYNRLAAYRGQKGRDALLDFWSLEGEFAAQVKVVEATGTQ